MTPTTPSTRLRLARSNSRDGSLDGPAASSGRAAACVVGGSVVTDMDRSMHGEVQVRSTTITSGFTAVPGSARPAPMTSTVAGRSGLDSISLPSRVAADDEAIGTDELGLATRNHGMPLEALRYDVTPVGLHYLLIHYDIPAGRPDELAAGDRRAGRPAARLDARRAARPARRDPRRSRWSAPATAGRG